MLNNIVTVKVESKLSIVPGDVIRTYYADDYIVTGVKTYRRNGGGLVVTGVRASLNATTQSIDLKTDVTEYPYGYNVSFNRSVS
jgi:hypothetical protein